jgi:hypothetical protein
MNAEGRPCKPHTLQLIISDTKKVQSRSDMIWNQHTFKLGRIKKLCHAKYARRK